MSNFSLEQVDELSGGDVKFKKELIELFLAQIPGFIGNMKKYFSESNIKNLAKEAHTAKSSALIFSMTDLVSILREIKINADNNKLEQIPELIVKTETELNAASFELKEYLKNMEDL